MYKIRFLVDQIGEWYLECWQFYKTWPFYSIPWSNNDICGHWHDGRIETRLVLLWASVLPCRYSSSTVPCWCDRVSPASTWRVSSPCDSVCDTLCGPGSASDTRGSHCNDPQRQTFVDHEHHRWLWLLVLLLPNFEKCFNVVLMFMTHIYSYFVHCYEELQGPHCYICVFNLFISYSLICYLQTNVSQIYWTTNM